MIPVLRQRYWAGVAGIFLLLVVSVVLACGLGGTPVGIPQAVRILAGGPGPTNAAARMVVLEVRFPRALASVLVGMLLAVSGALMQAFFRNVMAEPYLIGVSSGAALGAVVALAAGVGTAWGLSGVSLAAFLGALVIVAFIYVINARRGGPDPEGLLLSGIATASAVSAIVALVIIVGGRPLQQVLFWLLGSVSTASWTEVRVLAVYGLAGLLGAVFLARDLDLLMWGETTSSALGLEVPRSRLYVLAVASLLAAAAVSVAGIVGFVGLMVPHGARVIAGSLHRRLLPFCAALGGLVLLWADVAARCVAAPAELPLGAITAIVGAPFLVYLSRGRNRLSL